VQEGEEGPHLEPLARLGHGLAGRALQRPHPDGIRTAAGPASSTRAGPAHDLDLDSTELVERPREDVGLLAVPGEHLGLDRHLRVGFGLPRDRLLDGLDRIRRAVVALGG